VKNNASRIFTLVLVLLIGLSAGCGQEAIKAGKPRTGETIVAEMPRAQEAIGADKPGAEEAGDVDKSRAAEETEPEQPRPEEETLIEADTSPDPASDTIPGPAPDPAREISEGGSVSDEETHVSNPYFFTNNISQAAYWGRFIFDDFVEQDVKLNITELADLINGSLYELKLDSVLGVPDDRISLGHFYVQDDRIYKIEPTEENLSTLKAGGELPEGSVIVCQDEEIKDVLSEDEPGFHHWLEVHGDKREYRSYNNQAASGYYESFTWEKGKGLVYYRSGYGAERDSIELGPVSAADSGITRETDDDSMVQMRHNNIHNRGLVFQDGDWVYFIVLYFGGDVGEVLRYAKTGEIRFLYLKDSLLTRAFMII
jgi:hypothetical protein